MSLLPFSSQLIADVGISLGDEGKGRLSGYVGNDASRRAAENAGFVFEGTASGGLSYRGQRRDAWVGALLREEGTA